MTRQELLLECIKAETLTRDNPGFRITVQGLYKTKRVKVDRDFYGENVGHSENQTYLFLRCSDVKRYLSKFDD